MVDSEMRQVVAWRRPVQWITCAALWIVFAAASLPGIDLPLRAIAPLGFIAALFRTGVMTLEWRRRCPKWLRGVSLCADAGLLTGLLDITGGPFNPFVIIYVVYMWLAAASVSTAWAIAVGAVGAVTFGWLVADHLPAGLAEHHRLNDFPTHLFTMWFVGSSISELIAHYVSRARAALAQRQRELDDARNRAARSERLASLTTLAAGAAHELSTPLSTIAVAANELERTARLADRIATDTLTDDVRLIQEAVGRCRAILDGLSGRATGGVSSVAPMTPAAIAELACATLPPDRRRRLRLDVVDQLERTIPAGAEVSRALSSLLKNAFDASHDRDVLLRAYTSNGLLRFEVHDSGPGMSDEISRRAGEPFFTTKPPGEGLGLGLFLARTVAEQHGGSLRFERAAGTLAILEIPGASGARS